MACFGWLSCGKKTSSNPSTNKTIPVKPLSKKSSNKEIYPSAGIVGAPDEMNNAIKALNDAAEEIKTAVFYLSKAYIVNKELGISIGEEAMVKVIASLPAEWKSVSEVTKTLQAKDAKATTDDTKAIPDEAKAIRGELDKLYNQYIALIKNNAESTTVIKKNAEERQSLINEMNRLHEAYKNQLKETRSAKESKPENPDSNTEPQPPAPSLKL